jgi:hypothetical protein
VRNVWLGTHAVEVFLVGCHEDPVLRTSERMIGGVSFPKIHTGLSNAYTALLNRNNYTLGIKERIVAIASIKSSFSTSATGKGHRTQQRDHKPKTTRAKARAEAGSHRQIQRMTLPRKEPRSK